MVSSHYLSNAIRRLFAPLGFLLAGAPSLVWAAQPVEQKGISAALERPIRSLWETILAGLNHELLTVDGEPINLKKIVVALVFIVLGVLGSKYLTRLLARRILPHLGVGSGSAAALRTVVFYFLIAFVVISALRIANVPVTVFAVVGGAVAIGVGFGSQNVVNNFISGIIILLEQPIKPDDLIEVDGIFGRVETIGLRSTLVCTASNTHIVVPNSSFLEKKVLNWTLSDHTVRSEVTVGVAYGSPTRQTAALIRQAAQERQDILHDPAPIVLLSDFGDNALVFDLLFWTQVDRIIDRRIIQSRLRFRIDELFREAGIVIAFPQRDVHLDARRPLEVRLLDQDSKA